MPLENIVNKTSKFIIDNKKELALFGITGCIVLTDTLLTHHGCNGDPSNEGMSSIRALMESYGVNSTLIGYAGIKMAAIGTAISYGKNHNLKPLYYAAMASSLPNVIGALSWIV